MGLFTVMDNCGGPFGSDECANGIKQTLQFLSDTITQDSAGQVRLAYANTVEITGELVGAGGGGYPRDVHGTIDSYDYDFIVMGNPDVKVGNRAFISAMESEIVTIDRYGTVQAEIKIKFVR